MDLNEKKDVYEATFANLGINKVMVQSETVKQHQKLLVGGVGVWRISVAEQPIHPVRPISEAPVTF